MKYYIELMDSLKRGDIAPVYLFYGEEDYLQEQALKQFKENILEPGTADFNFDRVDGEVSSPGEIASLAETTPFMAGRRLLVVKEPRFFKGRTGTGNTDNGQDEILIEYFNRPLESTCLILITTNPVDKRKKIYKSLLKGGRAVEFTRLRKADLARWLAKQARQAGKSLESGAAEELLARVGNGLRSLSNEIEKVILYTGERDRISLEDVRRITVPPLEDSIFAVLDALAEGRCARALHGVRDLLALKHPPQVILAMLARQFRLTLQTCELMEQGCPAGELAGGLGIHPFAARKLISQYRKFNRTGLTAILEKLLDLDLQVKRGRLEFYPALELIILEICGEYGGKKG